MRASLLKGFNKHLPFNIQEGKNIVIVVLIAFLAIILLTQINFGKNCSSTLWYQDSQNNSELLSKIDIFLSSLGVFSTIFFAVVGYLFFDALKKQQEVEYYLNKIKKNSDEADELKSILVKKLEEKGFLDEVEVTSTDSILK